MPKKENKRQQEIKEIIEKDKLEQQKLKQNKPKKELAENKIELEKGKIKKSAKHQKQNEIEKKQDIKQNKEEKKKENQESQKKLELKETQEEPKKENKKQEQNKKANEKIEKASNTKISKIEEIEKEIKSNKKLPDEQQNQIHARVFQNIFLAVIIILYLNFIILGFKNIENSVFVVDLKVFSMSILVIAIGVIEYAYKKDSGRHAIHGIETLVLAIATMGFIYLNMMWQEKFIPIVVIVSLIVAIYYIAKTIIVYQKMKKQFSIENIKEIIKK